MSVSIILLLISTSLSHLSFVSIDISQTAIDGTSNMGGGSDIIIHQGTAGIPDPGIPTVAHRLEVSARLLFIFAFHAMFSSG